MERIPEELAPPVNNRSYTITADIDVPVNGAQGVLVSMGGLPGGYSLYLKDNKPVYVLNYYGKQYYQLRSDTSLKPGPNQVKFAFANTGAFQGRGELIVNGEKVAERAFERTFRAATPINETFDIGIDHGTAITRDYIAPFAFNGTIHKLAYDLRPKD